MGLWTLIACPAEQLGIELPRGGVDAISHDDLRHDLPLLVDSPEATFLHRMGQMQFVPFETEGDRVCAARGEGPALTVVATWPASVDEATAAAALISMAKAWDLSGGPTRRIELCIGRPGYVGQVDLGALATGPLVEVEGRFSSGTPVAGNTVDRVDFSLVQQHVRRIYTALESRPSRSGI